jgi:hypothetical protein
MKLLYLYRFRWTVLGAHQELENQSIYCSPLKDLNDPMEGFKDLYWSGDQIVWRNLLKHYLLCLDRACILFMLNGNSAPIDLASLPVLETENDLPTQEYKDSFKNSCDTFFNTAFVSECLDGLASRRRPIRRDELCSYLRMLHCHALNAVATSYRTRGITFAPFDDEILRKMCETVPIRPDIFGMTNGLEERHPDVPAGSDSLWAAMSAVHLQTLLIGKYNNPASSTNRNGMLIFAEFLDCYIKLIERMIYADWYMACFAASYTNSSMWGHYANSHKGVCLKFKTGDSSGNHSLTLNGIVALRNTADPVGAPVYGWVNHPLHEVKYRPTYPEIDFFRSLGHVRGIALRWWYSDGLGNNSSSARDVFPNEAAWREKYWREFLAGQTTKLRDWDYEEEYRLALSGSIMDYSKPECRALKYGFSDLQGIIFGMNTPEDDKLAMIRVVQAKCIKESRKDFEFYQAYYDKNTGKMGAAPLSLLTF